MKKRVFSPLRLAVLDLGLASAEATHVAEV